ncbi:MAG TPA: hypothetical protein DCL35_00295 [Candidatus Omnitrophica bacterium]|nr:hypothetical protein [Candidatus Omnitrophota bacterium]
MDILIIIICLAFIGLLGTLGYQFLKENIAGRSVQGGPVKQNDADPALGYQKKIMENEEKIKKVELDLAASKLELAQTKEREKALIEQNSGAKFDYEQYEKFKKDYQLLKQEIVQKEDILEKEISTRRAQTAELAQLKQDYDGLKKKLMETEDYYRRSQTVAENLTKELNTAKKTVEYQKKIVSEHTENKLGGEWVSRVEFEKVENELKEKETMIQKFLSLKKDAGGHA